MDYQFFSIYREMAVLESHNTNWIKALVASLYYVCGITYYAYDSYSAHGDPIDSHLDDIKLHHNSKEHPDRSSKAQEHYKSINIFS